MGVPCLSGGEFKLVYCHLLTLPTRASQVAKNKPAYFAKRLFKAMDGMGTDDENLCRIVATRCDVDMVEIKQAFHQMYDKPLGKMIKGDTSGAYEKMLLALIGGTETF